MLISRTSGGKRWDRIGNGVSLVSFSTVRWKEGEGEGKGRGKEGGAVSSTRQKEAEDRSLEL